MSQQEEWDYGGPVSDYREGAVFYRLRSDQVDPREAGALIMRIAQFMGDPGNGQPFVVRKLLVDGRDGIHYWVCLNSMAAGEQFERLLIQRQARVRRVFEFRSDNPLPPLKAVLGEPPVNERPAPRRRSAPPPQEEQPPRRQSPAEPAKESSTRGRGVVGTARAARDELQADGTELNVRGLAAGLSSATGAMRRLRDLKKRKKGQSGDEES